MHSETNPAPPPSTVLETLRAARELISDPDRWTQKHLARNEWGLPVDPLRSPDACRFCAMGALLAVTGDGDLYPIAYRALEAAVPADGRGRSNTVPWVNDRSDHGAVLRLFDTAIAAAEAA